MFKQLNAEVVGFERIKKEYLSCPDFGEIFGASQEIDGFLLQDDYLFQFRMLCIPVHYYEIILFGNCILGVLVLTSDERRP